MNRFTKNDLKIMILDPYITRFPYSKHSEKPTVFQNSHFYPLFNPCYQFWAQKDPILGVK